MMSPSIFKRASLPQSPRNSAEAKSRLKPKWTTFATLAMGLVAGGCSFANAPDDPIAPPPSPTTNPSPKLTECGANEFEVSASSTDGAPECRPHTICNDAQFETKAPTATSDRVCSALTGCGDDEFQSNTPTDSSDGECSPLTVCNQDQYESTAPTPTSDRVCSALTGCADDEFQSKAPTDSSDGECSPLTVCHQDQYESTAPTPTSDRNCNALTECNEGEYESDPPTATSDRVCAALSECSLTLAPQMVSECKKIPLDAPIMVDGFSSKWKANTSATSDTYVHLLDKDGTTVGESNLHVTGYAVGKGSVKFNAPVAVAAVMVCSWWNSATLQELKIEHRVPKATCE